MTAIKNEKVELTKETIEEMKDKLIAALSTLSDVKSKDDIDSDLLEDAYQICNTLMDNDKDYDLFSKIIEVQIFFLSSGNQIAVALLNNIVNELATSGYCNEKPHDPYTLFFVPVTSLADLGDSISLEGYDTIIQSALFESGITQSMLDAAVIPQAFCINFWENINAQDIFNFTSDFLENGINLSRVEDLSNDFLNSPIKEFYIPVFIKGEYSNLIEDVYDKKDSLAANFFDCAKAYTGENKITFSDLLTYEETLEVNINDKVDRENDENFATFFNFIKENKDANTRLALLPFSGNTNNYILASFDEENGTLKSLIPIIDETNYSALMAEILDFAIDNNIPMLEVSGKGDSELFEDLCNITPENMNIKETSQKQLQSLFSNVEFVDKNYLYKVVCASTRTIH